MKTKLFAPAFLVAAVCALIVLGWSAITLYHRASAERGNNTVELCLDWAEISAYCYRNGYPLKTFLGRAQAIGVGDWRHVNRL